MTLVDPGFWQRVTLSEETGADGADSLAVHYSPYVHDPDYSQYDGRFFLRTVDIIECEERLAGNSVISDYDPIAEFEREIEGRPRTPPRLHSTVAAAPPAPGKEPTPLKKGAARAKPRKRNTTDDALVVAPTKEPTPREKYKRFTADDDLVTEGVNGIPSTWPNPSQAAEALAPRAKGSSHDATVTRLRKKIGAALGD